MSRRKKTPEQIERDQEKGRRLKKAIGSLGQENIAELWGFSRSTISDRISGRTTISDDDAQSLCQIINVAMDERAKQYGFRIDPDNHVRPEYILCHDKFMTEREYRESIIEERVLSRAHSLNEHLLGVLLSAEMQLSRESLFAPSGNLIHTYGFISTSEQRNRLAQELFLYAKFLVYENQIRTASNQRELEIAQEVDAVSLEDIIDRLKNADRSASEDDLKEKAAVLKGTAERKKELYEGDDNNGTR